MSIKRYAAHTNIDDFQSDWHESKDGPMVKYEDYAESERYGRQADITIENLERKVEQLAARRDALVGEIARRDEIFIPVYPDNELMNRMMDVLHDSAKIHCDEEDGIFISNPEIVITALLNHYIQHDKEVLRNDSSSRIAELESRPEQQLVSALQLPPKLSNDRENAHELNAGVDTWNRCIDEVAKLNGQMIISGCIDSLHPSTAALVNDFATALAEKLRKAEQKYGYSHGWTDNGWMDECQTAFHEHVAKGDPLDVAAYCAFMWYHGWKTPAADAILAEVRASGVEMMREHPAIKLCSLTHVCDEFAAQLRQGDK